MSMLLLKGIAGRLLRIRVGARGILHKEGVEIVR